jgi:antirestriction protein ArdC
MSNSPSIRRGTGRDLYADVTRKIVDAIERGATSCTFPWHKVPSLPKNIVSGRAYRGVNTLLLWLIGQEKGYAMPLWATFRQWRELGHPVCAGEKAATIVFWKLPAAGKDTADRDDDDDRAPRRGILARAYHVFNAAQVQGYALPEIPVLADSTRDQAAEAFFEALPITVRHEGDRAFYQPSTDSIRLPPFARFKDANAYYATRGHESVHATGAKHRLDRELTARFGSEAYAVEELIAELGAAFLCADLRLTPEPRPDHAGYIRSWLKVLEGDTRAIFTAAGQAQAAVDWLHTAAAPKAPIGE